MRDHNIQDFLVLRDSQRTVTVLDDRMGASCIKSGDDPAFFVPSNRELCLVSIMIRLVHTDHWLHRKVAESTDPLQMTAEFLFFIRYRLKLASATLTG